MMNIHTAGDKTKPIYLKRPESSLKIKQNLRYGAGIGDHATTMVLTLPIYQHSHHKAIEVQTSEMIR